MKASIQQELNDLEARKQTYDVKKLAESIAKQRLAAKQSLKTLSKQDLERAMSKQIDFSCLYPEEFSAMVKYNSNLQLWN